MTDDYPHPVHSEHTHLARVPEALHGPLEESPHRQFVRYARLPSGATVQDRIECRCCRAPLASLAPDPRLTRQRRAADGSVIQEIGYTMQRTNAYAELPVEMRSVDGSLGLHVFTLCKECVAKERTPEEIAQLYLADIEQWALSDEVAGTDRAHTQAFLERMMWRQVEAA